MKAYIGTDSKEAAIPADIKAQADTYRAKLVEAIASADDKLIEKYIADEAISQEELETALNNAVITCKVVPIFTGSGMQNIGVTLFMDAIKRYLPSPKTQPVLISLLMPPKAPSKKPQPLRLNHWPLWYSNPALILM